MGLVANIYRSDYDSDLNAFYGKDKVTIVNVDGPAEPTEDAPAAVLSKNAFGNPILTPEPPLRPNTAGPMFGGTYAASSDSRFKPGFYGAVPIHDRYETWEQYDAMSR